MSTDNDYILFIGQESGFQSRSILIPADKFIKVRSDDYDLLIKSCKIRTFVKNGIRIKIGGVLKQKFVFDGNIGHQIREPYTQLCNYLVRYADGLDDDCYYDLKDKEWYDKSICNICSGFNHVQNYLICQALTEFCGKKINIVNSFLFVEMNS